MVNHIKAKSICFKDKLRITATAFNAGFPASVKEVVLSGLTKTKKLFQKFNKKMKHLSIKF